MYNLHLKNFLCGVYLMKYKENNLLLYALQYL